MKVKDQSARPVIRLSKWVALLGIMTALALVGNFVLVVIPNVELGTTILFITAYIFGPLMAVWSALIMSIIFSSINPWGGMIPLIWLAQLIGWVYVSLVGGMLGRARNTSRTELAVAGLVCTLVFDLITNIAYSLSFNIPILVALTTGVPFLLIHVVSNIFLFSLVVPTIHKAVTAGLAGMIWEPPKMMMELSDIGSTNS